MPQEIREHPRRALILGAGRQGASLARFYARRGARVVLNDRRSARDLASAWAALADTPVTWVTGGHPRFLVQGPDVVAVSGGVPLDMPLVVEARARDIPLVSDAGLFFAVAPCPTVGITGSAGKTTTTTLVGRIAAAASREVEGIAYSQKPEAEAAERPLPKPFRKTWVGGNIGNPLLHRVFDMHPDDVAVMEVSSFQLDVAHASPRVAVMLNITPNHLDRHGTMRAYVAAKARILAFQRRHDVAVLGWEDPRVWALQEQARGRVVGFGLTSPPEGAVGVYLKADTFVWRAADGRDTPLLPESAVALRGRHNRLNVAAALAVAHVLGLTPGHMRAGVEGFTGVPHRLELVRVHRGVAWYNDSIATSPARVLAALASFDHEPIVLLAGGRDKNLPWDAFARAVRQRVQHLVVFGEAGPLIREAVEAEKGPLPQTLSTVPDLESAVRRAAELAEPGAVVLLSPGCASFDEFRHFAERGEKYRQWVHTLT